MNQIEIHPFLAWDECVSYCEKEGIAVMAYSPLTKGRKLGDPSLCKIAEKYSSSFCYTVSALFLHNVKVREDGCAGDDTVESSARIHLHS